MGFLSVSQRSRIILSAGMPRSGSTWLFNAARLLLQNSPENGDVASCWIDDWPALPDAQNVVLKLHEFDPFLVKHANIVLYSFRDLRDALASNKRMFGTEPTIDIAKQWIDNDRRWRAKADLVMRYESMMADPHNTVYELANSLGIFHHDAEEILAATKRGAHEVSGGVRTPYSVRGSSAGGSSYNPETLLHQNHITDGRHGTWHTAIPIDLLSQIESEFGEWFTANEYPLTTTATIPAAAA